MQQISQDIIVDLGSGFTKIGCSNNLEPSIIKTIPLLYTDDEKDFQNIVNFISDIRNISGHAEIFEKALSSAIDNFSESNSDITSLFYLLHGYIQDKDLLKLTEIAFEKLNFEKFYASEAAALSLLASGLKTGIVVDSGYSTTSIVPVYDLRPINNSIREIRVGGRDITKKLHEIFSSSGINISLEVANFLKEKYSSFRVVNGDLERPKNYKLPDGSFLYFGDELETCPEILFGQEYNKNKFSITNLIKSSLITINDPFNFL